MTNRLSGENSPYLLQHAENPVDWYPWSQEALESARLLDRPIFLSIGYAACHWCHVMAHESFEDPRVAEFLNKNFVSIKVDREERPDLDDIYMNAVVAMTGQGGWPMSVFLTPEGVPFFGGTYFPPTRRYNIPSFMEILTAVERTWREDRPRILQAGSELKAQMTSQNAPPGSQARLNPQSLDEAALRLTQTYDWKHGGWGHAPKFPQPMAIEFLIRRASRGDHLAQEISSHALETMSKGGMYDVIGGGFARYSTDDFWLVPHFEKMLYDNAQLALAYLHGFLITKNDSFRQVCEETLDFITRELTVRPHDEDSPHGGFFSSLDADSEGEEGKFYLWTQDEIRSVLLDSQDLNLFVTAYGIKPDGNFEGRTVLQRQTDDVTLAQQFHLSTDEVQKSLIRSRKLVFERRETRSRPLTDNKVLVSWNALTLIAFSEAARYLKRPDYLDIARLNADFLLTELHPQDRLLRSWRNGLARHNAYLEDYASLVVGLLSLYQTDFDPYWFNSAQELIEEMLDAYKDPAGGFFDTRQDQELLILRPKNNQDNTTPSGNSLAAMALLQLSAFTGNGEYRDLAEKMLSGILNLAVKYPTAFAYWLCAADLATRPIFEIAILGDPNLSESKAFLETLSESYRPDCLVASSNFPPQPNSPALLFDRPLLNNQPTAYICQNFVCNRPVNQLPDFKQQLSQAT